MNQAAHVLREYCIDPGDPGVDSCEFFLKYPALKKRVMNYIHKREQVAMPLYSFPISEWLEGIVHIHQFEVSKSEEGSYRVSISSGTGIDEVARVFPALRRKIETVIDAIIITDAEPLNEPGPRVLFVNDAFSRMTGFSARDILGRSPRILQGPKTDRHVLDVIRAKLRNWEPVQAELLNYRKDGTEFWVELDIVPMIDELGWTSLWVAIQKDVTARKQFEQRLHLLYSAVNASHEGIVVMNAKLDGNGPSIIFANEGFTQMTGYSNNEVIGKSLKILQGPKTDFDFLTRLRESLKQGEVLKGEMISYRKDGAEFWIRWHSITPLRDSSGEVAHFIGVSQDITLEKRQSEEMVKAARLESLGVLAGGVAHDFNNSLTTIISTLTLAESELDNKEELRNLLSEVKQSCMEATALTRQLIAYARGGVPRKELFDFAKMVRDVTGFCLRGSQVRATYQVESDLPEVDGDEGQLRQVVSNIVINARQAMPEGGGVIISIKQASDGTLVSKELDSRPYLHLSIQDMGTGITPDNLKRIFDPYFTTKSGGTGLGLASCYSILRRHGGLIRAESNLGLGSTFHVFLPSPELGTGQAHTSARTSAAAIKGRILLVDDNVALTRSLSRVMAKHGYEVTVTQDGMDAARRYERAFESGMKFDLVILDLTIPGSWGGLRILEVLKEIDPHVKSIVSSGYAEDGALVNYREHGFSGQLAKPFQMDDLLRTIKTVMDL